MASTTWQKLADLEHLSRDLDARNVVFSERRVLVPPMIMGLAIGYTKSQLEPFVCSLKKTNFSRKIVLLGDLQPSRCQIRSTPLVVDCPARLAQQRGPGHLPLIEK